MLKHELKSVFVSHLSNLELYFQEYLPKDEIKSVQWVSDHMNAEIPETFTNEEAEQLIDISTDSSLNSRLQSKSLIDFWCSIEDEYPVVTKKALRSLIPFASSYLCECGFSAVAVMKSKYRGNLKIENEIRVALSKITPRFHELIKDKQAHPSH